MLTVRAIAGRVTRPLRTLVRAIPPIERRVAFVLIVASLMATIACSTSNIASMTLSEFTFKPKGINAVAGAPLTLTLINGGKIDHNWVLDQAASDVPVAVALAPGERKTVTFVPVAAGKFAYSCTVPGHAPAGMNGTLGVAQAGA